MTGRRAQLESLEDALGHTFGDPDLLAQALTHASYKNETESVGDDYERLEFLGDAVVQLSVSDLLYRRFPDCREGQLTHLRARLVNAATLASIATGLGLGELLMIGKGEERSGGRDRRSILSDALEALLGAVYLDAGFLTATGVMQRLVAPRLAAFAEGGAVKDAKSRLQEWAQQHHQTTPSYVIVDVRGPHHRSEFHAEVSVGEAIRARGRGRSKKEAEQQAATAAFTMLVDSDAGNEA